MSVGALRSWVYKLRRERGGAPAVSLLPVTIRPISTALQVDCGRHRLHFAAGTGPRYIAAVLRALVSDCAVLLPTSVKVWLAREPVDLRRGHDGLADSTDLTMLLDGIDLSRVRRPPLWQPPSAVAT